MARKKFVTPHHTAPQSVKKAALRQAQATGRDRVADMSAGDSPRRIGASGCRQPQCIQALLCRSQRHSHALHRQGAGPARHSAAWFSLPVVHVAAPDRGFGQGRLSVVVPDQRGFGQTDRPDAVEAYDMSQAVGDMVGLMAALGETSAVIVGHDLGAWVAQAAAMLRPDLFRALVMLNALVPPAERSSRPSACGKWRRAGCTTTCTSSRSVSPIASWPAIRARHCVASSTRSPAAPSAPNAGACSSNPVSPFSTPSLSRRSSRHG